MDLYIYTAPGIDSRVTLISVLNSLIDAIDVALKPGPGAGGLVSHRWIDGKVMKEPGDYRR